MSTRWWCVTCKEFLNFHGANKHREWGDTVRSFEEIELPFSEVDGGVI